MCLVRIRNVADRLQATYFSLGNQYDVLVKQYGPEFMWQVNERFLDEQFAMGKTFVLSHNPYTAVRSFGKESQFLIDHGFSFIQRGDVWIAVR